MILDELQPAMGTGGRRGQGMFLTTSAANIGRDEVFRDIPGGTGNSSDRQEKAWLLRAGISPS